MKKTLILILILGAALRFYGLNWDQDQHLHPDERFMTMVTQAIFLPSSFSGYFDTVTSLSNPHNVGFPFYVYGTLPLFTAKAVSGLFSLDSYQGITLVGRFISAGLEVFIIFLVYRISLIIFRQPKIALWSAFIYCLSALSVQLAHFYAVDTFLVFFLTLSFLFLVKIITASSKNSVVPLAVFLGLSFGCALASKINAALFLPVIVLGLAYDLYLTRNLKRSVVLGAAFMAAAFISLRLLQPYLFTGLINVNPKVIENWHQLKALDDAASFYPPETQWLKTTALLFPLENMFLWGWGPVLATITIFTLTLSVKYLKKFPLLILILVWILGLFFYQGLQLAKPMRYFYPIYPFLAVMSGRLVYSLWQQLKSIPLRVVFVFFLLYWPLAFVSIYSRPHTRVQASYWIYRNIPAGSILSCEYWDDCLPLGGNGPYQIVEYPLYDPDTPSKWEDMIHKLSQTDYIILSSNRLYGSIMTVPDRYPVTGRFYTDLFAGKLGFVKVAEFTSRPNLPVPFVHLCLTPPGINYGKIAYSGQNCPLPGISFVDDYADESWTVYDHPKVIIFQKVAQNNLPFY